MATRNRDPTTRPPRATRVNNTDEDPILKEKVQSTKAAKDAIKIHRSALSGTGPSSSTTTKGSTPYKLRSHRTTNDSSFSGDNTGEPTGLAKQQQQSRDLFGGDHEPAASTTTKISTPYKLRSRRTTIASSSPEMEAGDPTGLTKQKQQARDLFGEDYELEGPTRRSYSPPLSQSELESQSVEQLESYAVHRSQDVTQNIEDCVRVAQETTGIAATTMETLHDQGVQIRRTHLTAVRVEDDLTVGEKLLGSLGGMFSRRWKPKKGAKIKGPQVAPDSYKRRTAQADRAAVLSMNNTDDDANARKQAQARANKYEGLSGTQVQLEMERERQDGALSGLGDIVSQLKNMTSDMNEEVEKQTAAMGHMEGDLDTIDNRVKQAYNRTRYLVGR